MDPEAFETADGRAVPAVIAEEMREVDRVTVGRSASMYCR